MRAQKKVPPAYHCLINQNAMITAQSKCNNNKHNLFVFNKIWKKFNEIQLTKYEINLNNRKNSPPSQENLPVGNVNSAVHFQAKREFSHTLARFNSENEISQTHSGIKQLEESEYGMKYSGNKKSSPDSLTIGRAYSPWSRYSRSSDLTKPTPTSSSLVLRATTAWW